MTTTIPARGRRALARGALAAGLLTGALGAFAADAQAAYKASVKGGTLRITGNAAGDTLVLRLAPGSPTTLQVDVGGDGSADYSFDRGRFTTILVEAAAGDDVVRVDHSGGTFADEALTIDGGDGGDTLLAGVGADTLIGGRGNDVVSGGDGNDTAQLGPGDDTSRWIPGDDSDVVEGGTGIDGLEVSGSGANERIELSANGARLRFTRDVANVAHDLNDVERVRYQAFAGSDTVVVGNLSGTDATAVDVDLNTLAGGDALPDSVIVHGTGLADAIAVAGSSGAPLVSGLTAQVTVTGGETLDVLEVRTQEGDDVLNAGIGVPGPMPVYLNGGEGADTTRYSGTPAGDAISVVANGVTASVNVEGFARVDSLAEQLAVFGLAGEDTITAVGNLAALTTLTMDGGEHNDVLLGGNGADLLLGGPGQDAADGNQGADRILLGDGGDRFEWSPGDGSDTVEGQAGTDLIDFFGSSIGETVDVSANGGRVRLTRDIAAISMDIGAVEHLAVHALAGTDTIAVHDLTGTALAAFDVGLGLLDGSSDGQIDTVTVTGTDGADTVSVGAFAYGPSFGGLGAEVRVAAAETHDLLTLETRGGADTITAQTGIPGPAVIDVLGGDAADTMRFNGTAAPEEIGAVANGAEVSIVEASTTRLDTTGVERHVLLGAAGEDWITATGNLAALTELTMDGGADNDTLHGGNGADQLVGGTGNDVVDGNQGIDAAQLGEGEDTFHWDPGDGSETIEGGAGNDTLEFFGSGANEQIRVAANGARLRFTRDVAAITLDGDDIERVATTTFAGTDTITVDDLAGTDTTAVDIDLAAFGGGGDTHADGVVMLGTVAGDSVTVDGSGGTTLVSGLAARVAVTGGEAVDHLDVQGLSGDDTLGAAVGVPGPMPIYLYGGEDIDTTRYSGSEAADTISVIANGATASVNVDGSARVDTLAEQLVVQGLGGEDTIGAVGNLLGLTALTIDGGADNDVLRGGNGADLLLGGQGHDQVDGNQGADQALLGDGDDRFQWDPGDGNDVVEGQAGNDRLDFNGSGANEQIGVSANGARVRFTRDIANIALDLDDVEQIAYRAFGGADTVTVHELTGTDAAGVDVDLGLFDGSPDGQADVVVVSGTNGPDVVGATTAGSDVVTSGLAALVRVSRGEAANDTLRIQTLDGDDDVTVAPEVSGLLIPVVDLGAGE